MAQPRGQQGKASLHVMAVAVPVEHGGHRVGVPQVMEPAWPVAGADGDPGCGHDLFEGDAQTVRVERCPSAIHEEGRAGPHCSSDPVVADLQVVAQDRRGGRVEEHKPGLAELGVQNLHHTVGQVHVADGQVAGLPGPQPCGGQQTDQRSPGHRPEPGGQAIGSAQEREDLGTFSEALPALVNMGVRPPVAWVHERLGIPVAQGNEPVLMPPGPLAPTATAATTAVPPVVTRTAAPGDVPPPQQMQPQLAAALAPAVGAWIDQVRELVMRAQSLTEIRDGLDALLPDMTLDQYAAAMAVALRAAEMAGRYEVLQEAGGPHA